MLRRNPYPFSVSFLRKTEIRRGWLSCGVPAYLASLWHLSRETQKWREGEKMALGTGRGYGLGQRYYPNKIHSCLPFSSEELVFLYVAGCGWYRSFILSKSIHFILSKSIQSFVYPYTKKKKKVRVRPKWAAAMCGRNIIRTSEHRALVTPASWHLQL